jgi:hypothetical protein
VLAHRACDRRVADTKECEHDLVNQSLQTCAGSPRMHLARVTDTKACAHELLHHSLQTCAGSPRMRLARVTDTKACEHDLVHLSLDMCRLTAHAFGACGGYEGV